MKLYRLFLLFSCQRPFEVYGSGNSVPQLTPALPRRTAIVRQMVAVKFLIRIVWQRIFGMGRGNACPHMEDPPVVIQTRWTVDLDPLDAITPAPFPDPSRPQRKRPLSMVTERSISMSYPRDNQNGVIREFYSTPFVFLTDAFTDKFLCGGHISVIVNYCE
jgi:hypothetical protein